MLPFEKFYCISLPSRTDRRSECEAIFAAISLNVEFVSPVVDSDPNRSLCRTVASLLEQAKRAGLPHVCILEDDVEFIHHEVCVVPPVYDLFYLGFACHSTSVFEAVDATTLRLLSLCSSTHAVVYNKNVFDETIALLSKGTCIDEHLQKTFQPRKNVYCTNPPIAIQRKSKSDLSTEPYRSNMKFVTLDQYNAYCARVSGAKPIIP